MASLKLSDDQKEKMETVCKEVGGLFRDEMHKIRDLLTESQKEKLSELKDDTGNRHEAGWPHDRQFEGTQIERRAVEVNFRPSAMSIVRGCMRPATGCAHCSGRGGHDRYRHQELMSLKKENREVKVRYPISR